MSGMRRAPTPEELSEAGPTVTTATRRAPRADELAEGEPGNPGHDPYAGGPNAHQPTDPAVPEGDLVDAAKSWANRAALGAGPVIEGGLAALLQPAMNSEKMSRALSKGEPAPTDLPSMGDAYRAVRDMGAKEHAAAAHTRSGELGGAVGTLSTPIPVKALPAGASALARGTQAAKVGGAVGGINALATNPEDLTDLDSGKLKRALVRTLVGTGTGAGGGFVAGATLAPVEKGLRSTAETQALRSAGLEAGIKNSIQKDLGITNMTDARALGRKFLDEGLIPPVGSSEAVASRAQNLENEAGNAIGSTMQSADVATMHTPPPPAGVTAAGRPSNVAPRPGFDFDAMGNASHDVLKQASAPADLMSGQKARDLADAFKAQESRTPGSFVGANRAKSDAWKSARFDQDAPMSAVLYRKAVGAARDDIERQVADALGPDAAAGLNSANQRYGVAADALKLAENSSTRAAARKGLTTSDIVAALTSGTAGGLSGHPGIGLGGGLGLVLAKKAADKYGHSTAARFSDFLAKRAAGSTGGVAGAQAATAANPYLELLDEDQK